MGFNSASKGYISFVDVSVGGVWGGKAHHGTEHSPGKMCNINLLNTKRVYIYIYIYIFFFFSSGAATQRGSWPPHF